MNLTILWSSLASYSVSFFKELARQGCNIQLVFQPIDSGAPYNHFDLSFCNIALEDSASIKHDLYSMVRNFKPDCILMSSWCFPHFMKIAKSMRKENVYVVSAMDNQWHGNIKQYIGIMTSRFFLKPSIDTFLVSGDRQAYFARKLGYEHVLYGLYAADIRQFASNVSINQRSKNFLFVGRLTQEKGIDDLVKAYIAYRDLVDDPWGLIVVGTGPLGKSFQGIKGISLQGFVQPGRLPALMNDARCFILPSRWEPWGVAIHEAAAAGLPVIATYACGASSMVVRDGLNGFIVSPNHKHIANAMVRITKTSGCNIDKMSNISTVLAGLWSPDMLAHYFIDSIKNAINGVRV